MTLPKYYCPNQSCKRQLCSSQALLYHIEKQVCTKKNTDDPPNILASVETNTPNNDINLSTLTETNPPNSVINLSLPTEINTPIISKIGTLPTYFCPNQKCKREFSSSQALFYHVDKQVCTRKITSNVSPITSNLQPITSNVLPITSNVLSIASNVSPITSDVSPIAHDFLPIAHDFSPVISDLEINQIKKQKIVLKPKINQNIISSLTNVSKDILYISDQTKALMKIIIPILNDSEDTQIIQKIRKSLQSLTLENLEHLETILIKLEISMRNRDTSIDLKLIMPQFINILRLIQIILLN